MVQPALENEKTKQRTIYSTVCRNSENVAVYFHTDIHYGWLKGKGGRGRDTNGLGVYWREGGIERNIGQAHASCRLSRFATNDRFAD